MKLTKSKLKQIIKEEMYNLLNEVEPPHVEMHRRMKQYRQWQRLQQLERNGKKEGE